MKFVATYQVTVDATDAEDALQKAKNCREYGEFDSFQLSTVDDSADPRSKPITNGDYDDLKADFELIGLELDRVNAELARVTAQRDQATQAIDELGAGLVARRNGLAVSGFDINGLLQKLSAEAGES